MRFVLWSGSSLYGIEQNASAPKTLVGAQTIYNHKPLDEDEKKKLEGGNGTPTEGASAWNKAGTWEEKDFSKWASERLKEALVEIKPAGGLATFSAVSTVDECHASVVHTRGKKKAILEVDKIKVTFKTEAGGKGSLTLTEVSSTDLDDMVVKAKVDKAGEGGDEKAIAKAVESTRKEIEGVINALVEELRAK
mmetsp:Transcript_4694/g.11403  ORF Transcript_4694/g.11403 Transcript_4694/m.11403 type:complete len:193 (-) Transcript_4694:341-919(-)